MRFRATYVLFSRPQALAERYRRRGQTWTRALGCKGTSLSLQVRAVLVASHGMHDGGALIRTRGDHVGPRISRR